MGASPVQGFKKIFFSLHNNLAKHDYSYIIDTETEVQKG